MPPGTVVEVTRWKWMNNAIRLELSAGYGFQYSYPSVTYMFNKGFQGSATRESVLSVISGALILEDFDRQQRTQAEYLELKNRLDSARSAYASAGDSERLKAGEELQRRLKEMASNRSTLERLTSSGKVDSGAASVSGKYLRKGKSSDFIELSPNGGARLFKDGTSYSGRTYKIQGDSVKITSPGLLGTRVTGRLSGNTLMAEGEVWEKQTGQLEPSVGNSAQCTKEAADLEPILNKLREKARAKRIEETGSALKDKDRQIDALLAEVKARKFSGLAQWREHDAKLAQVRRLLEEKVSLHNERAGFGQAQSGEEVARLTQQQQRFESLIAALDTQRIALGRLQIDEDYRVMDRKLAAQFDIYTRAFGTPTFTAEANHYLVLLQKMYDNRLLANKNGSQMAAGQAAALLKKMERTKLQLGRSP